MADGEPADATIVRLERLPGRSDLAQAIRYARRRWFELTRYLDDGRREISNHAAELLPWSWQPPETQGVAS